MATVIQTQVRCTACNRRLGDFVNQIELGQVILELKCPKCGQPHLEVIRKPDGAVAEVHMTPERESLSGGHVATAQPAGPTGTA